MSTCTVFGHVKHNTPLTSHQSLLTCSQVKADATETLQEHSFANNIMSRARENNKNDHDDSMNNFWKCQTENLLTSYQGIFNCLQVNANVT